jgi:transposase
MSIEFQLQIAMPRRVQPGGVSGMPRLRYTARRKLGLISAVRAVMDKEGLSLNKAAAFINVSSSLISKWAKQSDILREALSSCKKSNCPHTTAKINRVAQATMLLLQRHQKTQSATIDRCNLLRYYYYYQRYRTMKAKRLGFHPTNRERQKLSTEEFVGQVFKGMNI